jgi:hypothetical protein
VQQAKDATGAILQSYMTTHQLAMPAPDRILPAEIALTLSDAARDTLHGQGADALLTLLRQGDYFGLLAYLGPDAELAAVLQEFRRACPRSNRRRHDVWIRTTLSALDRPAAQGWPNTGVFLLITASPRQDVPIPGDPFSFGTLEQAQAVGRLRVARSREAAGAAARTWRRRIAYWFVSSQRDCWRGCSPTALVEVTEVRSLKYVVSGL